MTLVLTVNGPETVWLLADRRVTYPKRPPKDDARKLMFLETTDGVTILGYTGLGATPMGTEPADWMSYVLRGRNLPLEKSLGVLAEAMKKQIPRQLIQLSGPGRPSHSIVATAFVDNEARLYTIDMVMSKDKTRYRFRYTRHIAGDNSTNMRTPRTSLGGSGSFYLIKHKKWLRPLLQLARASDQLELSPLKVADHLADINHEVHLNTLDGSVGPRCIVAWRHRKNGVHKGGGAHQFYSGKSRENPDAAIPTISTGTDLNAVIAAIMPFAKKDLKALMDGKPTEPFDKDGINEALSRLPDKPDEELH